MEAFSDDEFYEAREDISSVSNSSDGSSSSPDEEEITEIGGNNKQQKQRSRRGPAEWSSKPPRHHNNNQAQPPPQWFTESRFSIWQDGPKSIQERRRLLYERFGIIGRKDEKGEGREEGGGAQIRATRFGMREHASSPAARNGLIRRAGNSSVDTDSSEFGYSSGNRPADDRGNNTVTTTPNSSSTSDEAAYSGGGEGFKSSNVDGSQTLGRLRSESVTIPNSSGSGGEAAYSGGESFQSATADSLLPLGRSRSDSAALLIESKKRQSEMGAIARSLGASPNSVPGIERLTQTSGAVLREGKRMPSSSKPPTGSRVAVVASKSVPSNNPAVQLEEMSNGMILPALDKREVLHPNALNAPSAAASLTGVSTESKLMSAEVTSRTSSQTWVFDEESVFDSPSRHLAADSVGGLVDALQNMVGAAKASNQDRSLSFDEKLNDIACKIKDLDSGKEFIIHELGTDGDPKLRELDTGKELTLDEFESSLGLSPIMQEVKRREREQYNLEDDDTPHKHDSTASSKKKKKSLWVRTMKGVAKSVGGASKTKAHQDPSKGQVEGSRGESGGEERDGSVGSQREGSVEKGSKPHSKRVKNVPDDLLEPSRHKSPQRVKVHVYKKTYKDLSDLNLGQEIQAHQGAIWTMKFSLDGRYLASAGQDRVVHVREVLEHPFSKDQDGRNGVVETSGAKIDTAAVASPEHSQQSQECSSLGRRGSLRGSIGKRKSAKSNSMRKLPKLFWLSETAVCSFKGHTEDVLDLSWSRSEFLLSSSMDKTVRLWRIPYGDCLRVFDHNDYVTCIEFSPTDDRYFLSGSLDDKVRIWNIPDHQVVDWSDVHEMVAAASYSPDGKRAAIGTYKGTCRFYNTTGHKLQLDGQIDVRNAQSKKSRGKKITGLEFMPGDSNKVLITSNDSRVRVYDGQELSLKFKGLRIINSRMSASFNRSGEYIVSASEDNRVYIWNSGLQEFRGRQKDKPQAYEHFLSSHVSTAVPWHGMDPQSAVSVAKEDQNELDTSSSRQSGNDGRLRSTLTCSSSSSSSNGSTQSGSGPTSESVGECKSEQSLSSIIRNGSGREVTDEEVTSRRIDGNGTFLGHYDKPGMLIHNSFRESPGRDYGIQASAVSPALSVSNDSPRLGQTSLRSPRSSFFADITPKGSASATWPEEKLPPLQDSIKSQGGSWSASSPSPSQGVLSTELSPDGSTAGDATAVASWGLVIVTASLGGEIRTFQNYGYPIRL